MEVSGDEVVEVTATDQVGDARRHAQSMARRAGFGELDQGRVGIAVTEAATNLVRHGGGGSIVLTQLAPEQAGLRMLAIDRGPGIRDVPGAMHDGASTIAGSAGTGLGAIARQSDTFDVYSWAGRGTAVLAEFFPERKAKPNALVGGVSVPAPGESVCGDAWAARENGRHRTLLVADGVGHGPMAHAASQAARRVLDIAPDDGPAALVARMHRALRATRGAAVAVAELDEETACVRFCGVGNVSAWLVGPSGTRGLVSHYGTLGHEVGRFQEFQYQWGTAEALVLASDGLMSHWDLSPYIGLLQRHPALVAGVLYRDFRRGRDDATVVVLRRRA